MARLPCFVFRELLPFMEVSQKNSFYRKNSCDKTTFVYFGEHLLYWRVYLVLEMFLLIRNDIGKLSVSSLAMTNGKNISFCVQYSWHSNKTKMYRACGIWVTYLIDVRNVCMVSLKEAKDGYKPLGVTDSWVHCWWNKSL